MGKRYSTGVDVSGPIADGAAYAELLAGATSINVIAIRLTNGSNGGGHIALRRSFAVGTGTTIATGMPHRELNTGASARLITAWSQAPTGLTPELRHDVLQSATGVIRDLWRAEDGPISVEPNKSLLIMSHGSGVQDNALHINVTWEEGPASDQ